MCCCLLLTLTACSQPLRQAILPTEVSIFLHHYHENMRAIEEFSRRLYAKNPRYEPEPSLRDGKLRQIFAGGLIYDASYAALPSHELLTLAFAEKFKGDRVFVLCYGLAKSVREVYGDVEKAGFLTGLQLPVDRLQRLHFNLSQANWRLKVTRDARGEPLFRANESGENGYINMGYEVLMTSILTRIEDDIHLRGGLPQKYAFSTSTIFVSLLL